MRYQQPKWRHHGRVAASLMLLGSVLAWPGFSAADPICTIIPENPTLSTGDSIQWSADVNDLRRRGRTYNWSFNEGQPSSSTRSSPEVSYNKAGTWKTVMTVSDGSRETECRTKVTVRSGDDTQAPTVSISASPAGPIYTSAQTVAINAGATDNVDVTKVEFYDNGALKATDNVSPYSHPWSITAADNGTHSWSARAYDAANSVGNSNTLNLAVNIDIGGGGPLPDVSINSTSQSCGDADETGMIVCQDIPVDEQPRPNNQNSLDPAPGTGDSGHQILAINDLGMHCGDLDTRVASILPPFQVLLSQVIRKGSEPELLGPTGSNAVEVVYSAASNPADPILAAGAGAFTGLTSNGDVYKTNFWNVIASYDPFYPPGVLCTDPAAPATCGVDLDTGLPVPNVEHLYIGPDGEVDQCDVPGASCDGFLSAVQHAMPGIADPYIANDRHVAEEHYGDKPFFVNFPFGYVADDVNWFEGAGIPFASFDDFGRDNAYPLVRVQAKAPGMNGQVLATVDTVLPISGEASCKNCHGSPAEITGRTAGVATVALDEAGLPVEDSTVDDLSNSVPVDVSVEYATDINILRLHDLKHGAEYRDADGNETPCSGLSDKTPNGNADCLANRALEQGKSVVCQVCHYTPALDLAQFGPLGGDADSTDPNDALANGRVQRIHKSNSRVMHHHHGSLNQQFPDLFPPMPAPEGDGADGLPTNHADRQIALEQTCYQCHPGTNTKCLRGAMSDGGMVCQDCHGGMLQVGNDFTAKLDAENPFPGGADLSLRVPWANEPGCGSCHTGDAVDNLADPNDPAVAINAVDSYGNMDDIRLIRAYMDSPAATTPSSPTADTTPIVPGNKRFAEPLVPASFNGFANPGAGNPKLYRVSTGHGGVFCEGCHGATHAEWDTDGSSLLNDNVTANQLQGHSGTVTECSACHAAGWEPSSGEALDGPHGMHVVGGSRFADGGHEDLAETNSGRDACRACHGSDGQGTVLSRVATDREFVIEECEDGTLCPGREVENFTVKLTRGEPVSCVMCHENEL